MNRIRFSTFSKLLFLIVALLLPIIGLYFYSNSTSINVVRKEIETSKINQLTFFSELINNALVQLSVSSNMLSADPEVQRVFYRVMDMTSSPAALLRPGIARRVLRHWLGTRRSIAFGRTAHSGP